MERKDKKIRGKKKMKLYICKYCGFYGIRPIVRKHLREVHYIRGLAKDVLGKRMESEITKQTITKEI